MRLNSDPCHAALRVCVRACVRCGSASKRAEHIRARRPVRCLVFALDGSESTIGVDKQRIKCIGLARFDFPAPGWSKGRTRPDARRNSCPCVLVEQDVSDGDGSSNGSNGSRVNGRRVNSSKEEEEEDGSSSRQRGSQHAPVARPLRPSSPPACSSSPGRPSSTITSNLATPSRGQQQHQRQQPITTHDNRRRLFLLIIVVSLAVGGGRRHGRCVLSALMVVKELRGGERGSIPLSKPPIESPIDPLPNFITDMRGYDAHPSMFAPSGRIPQIEYAREVRRLIVYVCVGVGVGGWVDNQ